jgi:transcriptional regulator with XRE-family HTH domain
MEGIAEIIERYRATNGPGGGPMSYADLGKRIGVSRAQAENFCKGRSIPSDKAVMRICQEMGENEMKMLILEHHDRAPDSVKPVWREVLGRLDKRRRNKAPDVDGKVIKVIEGYKQLPHAGRAAFVRLADIFFLLSNSFRKKLYNATKEWVESHEKLEEVLGPK